MYEASEGVKAREGLLAGLMVSITATIYQSERAKAIALVSGEGIEVIHPNSSNLTARADARCYPLTKFVYGGHFAFEGQLSMNSRNIVMLGEKLKTRLSRERSDQSSLRALQKCLYES